jgi:phosphatidylglycerol:prolipoprotein diacylglycerol transferase
MSLAGELAAAANAITTIPVPGPGAAPDPATFGDGVHWVHNLDPVALHIGFFDLRWYSLAYLVGIILGYVLMRRLIRQPGAPMAQRHADDLVFFITLGIILGGRLGYVLFYQPEYYLAHPFDVVKLWDGGMSFHGGLIGSVLAIWFLVRRNGLSFLRVCDYVALCAPLGLFFGRIANFVNGELWGRVAPDFPYAVVFPSGGPLPRHPSQLYEAATEGLLLFIVMAIAVRRFGFRKPGLLGGIFVLGYALARTFCEFFREPDRQLGFLFGDHLGPMGGGVTMGMLLCVPMMIVGLTYIVLAATGRTRPRHPVQGPVAAEEARKAPVEA